MTSLCWASDFWQAGNAFGYSVHNRMMREHVSKYVRLTGDAPTALTIASADKFRPVQGKFNFLFTMFETEHLPASYVRFDDLDVLKEIRNAAAGRGTSPAEVVIDENLFYLRLLLPSRQNLGSMRHPDHALAAIDVRSSETGRYPLAVRHVLYRMVCSNGLTVPVPGATQLRRGYAGLDRERFRHRLAQALEDSFHLGGWMARLLARTRSHYLSDPLAELEGFFRRYRLGGPRSPSFRWAATEVMRNVDLLGVTRFEFVQAITRTAQKLDHEDRLRWEDAAGAYLSSGEKK